VTSGPTRRLFLARSVAAGVAAMSRRLAAVFSRSEPSGLTHGPFLGHLHPTGVSVWARCAEPGTYFLSARRDGAEVVASAEARPESNQTVVWELAGLVPEARYGYEIRHEGRTIFSDPDASFVTPPRPEVPTVVTLAIGSCAREQEGDRAVWRRMAALDPDAVVLLGDTPYIDSTDLSVQRTRYGEFAAVLEFGDLLRGRPLYAIWDDHDFGANDTDGRLPGKENARQAFIEFHANPSYGDGREGVYTSFRRGGVEVFLLDTRYFAGTELSPIADGPSALGSRQWEWLRDGLRASDAPFKLLASGIVWNGAVRPGKPDHWESYREEREALFRFIGDEGISGVVLVGGDVHRTRVLRYDTRDTAGYALTELVTSPMHADVIVEANVPHPALVHDSGEPHAFLLLTVDTTAEASTLLASFQNAAGRELYALTLKASELTVA
jgi:alkaline phosphatase D